MSLPNRIECYDDCFEAFDRALADPRGARVKYATASEAHHFMFRLHQARALQRDLNSRLYEPTDPRYGTSEYARLIIRRPREDTEGFWWVYIDRSYKNALAVESLSEIEE